MNNNYKLGSLTKRSEFLYVREGHYKAQGAVVVQIRKCPVENTDVTRAGFTATKRIGNAVTRNRAKRRLRAIARTILPQYGLPGYDYVFIARDSTTARPFARLLDDCSKALLSLRSQVQNHVED